MDDHTVVSDGSPYDHKKPLTCPHCIAIVLSCRADLCERYGWKSWPTDIGFNY